MLKWILGIAAGIIIALLILSQSAKTWMIESTAGLFEKPSKVSSIQNEPYNLVLVADGTGSNSSSYAIPQLDTLVISSMIDSIYYRAAGGRIWVTYIDRDSKNNAIETMGVPKALLRRGKPSKGSPIEQNNAIKRWKSEMANFASDSAKMVDKFFTAKSAFLKKVSKLLSKVYIKGSKDNQYTDVNGSLNSIFRIMNSLPESTFKTVVLFSDCENDPAPNSGKLVDLELAPIGVKILSLNPVAGSTKKASEDILEVESMDRLIEEMFINRSY